MTVLGRRRTLDMRLWMTLAAAFLAVGLLVAVTGDKRIFALLWSGVLLSALATLTSDWDRGAVLGAGLLSAFIYATGTHDKVYTFGAVGVVCIMSVIWIRTEDQDTTWNLGVMRIALRPSVARLLRLALGLGLLLTAILKAWSQDWH